MLDPAIAGGSNTYINRTEGVAVNGARVIVVDIPRGTGVIQAIDTVLLPTG